MITSGRNQPLFPPETNWPMPISIETSETIGDDQSALWNALELNQTHKHPNKGAGQNVNALFQLNTKKTHTTPRQTITILLSVLQYIVYAEN